MSRGRIVTDRGVLNSTLGSPDETVDDVVRSMLGYASSMRRRYREAAEGDKSLPCAAVAMRMDAMAGRVKRAMQRERAMWRAKIAEAVK